MTTYKSLLEGRATPGHFYSAREMIRGLIERGFARISIDAVPLSSYSGSYASLSYSAHRSGSAVLHAGVRIGGAVMNYDEMFKAPIEGLNLNVRSANVLPKAGIATVGDAVRALALPLDKRVWGNLEVALVEFFGRAALKEAREIQVPPLLE